MFSVMLTDAYQEERPGIRVAYRTDGQLLNRRRGHVKGHGNLRHRLRQLRSDHQHGENGGHVPAAPINLNDAQLQAVDNFTYLGITLSRSTQIDNEVDLHSQSSLRSPAERCLESSRSLSQHQARDLQSCHLANAVEWNGDLGDAQEAGAEAQLFSPQLSPEDTKLKWRSRIPNTGVLERTGIHAMLRQLKPRWSGHLVRMGNGRLPK
nr:unnamed protein product [Spirometra erinaceieuropaei]